MKKLLVLLIIITAIIWGCSKVLSFDNFIEEMREKANYELHQSLPKGGGPDNQIWWEINTEEFEAKVYEVDQKSDISGVFWKKSGPSVKKSLDNNQLRQVFQILSHNKSKVFNVQDIEEYNKVNGDSSKMLEILLYPETKDSTYRLILDKNPHPVFGFKGTFDKLASGDRIKFLGLYGSYTHEEKMYILRDTYLYLKENPMKIKNQDILLKELKEYILYSQ